MKQASEYAKRVKRLYHQLIRKFGRPADEDAIDPIEQLIIGILSGCTSHSKAQSVFRRLRQEMVDLNELRVTPPMELAEAFGDGLPLAKEKAQRVVDALNAIRKRQDSLDLSFLRQRGRREARDYLESLEGVDKAAAASVVLHSLGGHAIPVDDLTLYILQKEEIIEPHTDVIEVQSFLEHHISAANAKAFSDLLGRWVSLKGAKVPIDKLADMLRPPPPPPPPPPPAPEPVKSATKATAGKNAPLPSKSAPAAKVKPAPPKIPIAAKPKAPAVKPKPALVKKKK